MENPVLHEGSELLRAKVFGFLKLEAGWDTYQGAAPSQMAVDAALVLVDGLAKIGTMPDWVAPTSDASLLMRVRFGDDSLLWEFHSDGDVAAMWKSSDGKESFHDLAADGVLDFLSVQLQTE